MRHAELEIVDIFRFGQDVEDVVSVLIDEGWIAGGQNILVVDIRALIMRLL
jgi:hypothetical protein